VSTQEPQEPQFSEEELREGIAIIDRGLAITDKAVQM